MHSFELEAAPLSLMTLNALVVILRCASMAESHMVHSVGAEALTLCWLLRDVSLHHVLSACRCYIFAFCRDARSSDRLLSTVM